MAESGAAETGLGPVIDLRAEEAERSLGGLAAWRAEHSDEVGAPCANCAVPISGPYCTACGQSAESFERSIGSLFAETVEGLFHADGRLPHTLRNLVLRPGVLTRDYLDGRRVSQTPPLRLFLAAILVFFFVGGLGQASHPPLVWLKADGPPGVGPSIPGADLLPPAVDAWLAPRVAFASAHQREFGEAVDGRLHETAIVFLPIFTLLWGAFFAFGRRIFLFDHAIFSMHSLAFMSFLFSAATLSRLAGLPALGGLLFLVAPAHLFLHLRAVYALGPLGAAVRVALLLVFSAIVVGVMLFADVLLGLNAIGGAA